MTRPRPRNETASTSTDQSPAVSPPSGIDPDWRERIEIAKQAREQARKARSDRPATFDRRGLPISWLQGMASACGYNAPSVAPTSDIIQR